MTSSLILNEALMIKDRLQEAFNTIQLISDNDFTQDSNYKHSHQVLRARIKRLEEEEDTQCVAVRFVQDVIPNSHLTRYGRHNNELRYMASNNYGRRAGTTSFLFPNLSREPWMLPEVEQIFLHTMFSASANFNLYENQLAKMEKLSEYGDECCHDFFSFFDTPEYQKLSAASAREKSPELLNRELPYYFNVTEFDGYNLRQRILSDKVRSLWGKKKFSNKDRFLEIHKTLLENLAIHEDEFQQSLKADDLQVVLTQLKMISTNDDSFCAGKKLVTFILDLNSKIPNMIETNAQHQQDAKMQQQQHSSNELQSAPQRRLYSDVVQGAKMAQQKAAKGLYEPSSLPALSNGYTDDSLTSVNSSTIFLHASEGETKTFLDFEDHLQLDVASTSSIGQSETGDSHIGDGSVTETTSPRQTSSRTPSPNNCSSYSDAVNNSGSNTSTSMSAGGAAYNINQFNMPFANNDTIFDLQSSRTNNFNVPSATYHENNSLHPATSSVGNSDYLGGRLGGYGTNTTNNTSIPTSYPARNYTNQPQHHMLLNRAAAHNMNQNWYLTPPPPPPPVSYRHHTTPYSVFLLPQIPSAKHRWTNPQYARPTTPTQPSAPPLGSNTWPSTTQPIPINRSASSHQVNCYSIFDSAQKKLVTTNINKYPTPPPQPGSMVVTKGNSPESGNSRKFSKKTLSTIGSVPTATAAPSKYPCKILTKPHSDYRIMARQQQQPQQHSSEQTRAVSLDGRDEANLVPVTTAVAHDIPATSTDMVCSESDELEKIALREYQSSNDLFFTEIERQAEEQYDDNSENSHRPPNRENGFLLVGGLRAFNFIFHLYLSINTR